MRSGFCHSEIRSLIYSKRQVSKAVDRLDRVEEVLAAEEVFVTTTSGMSMYPMLRHRRDTVVIRPVCGRLKKYDVPLYRRGDEYVLHRIIRVNGDGTYDIRGDNCFLVERSIPEDCVIGYLDGFTRGEKEIRMDSFGYRIYSRVWVTLHPIICIFKRCKEVMGKMCRRKK